MDPILFPGQPTPDNPAPLDRRLTIFAPRPLGLIAKIHIHYIAQKLPLYYRPIVCDIEGKDKKGNKIAVNNVGRWLFGVPGYAGRCRITVAGDGKGDKVLFFYPSKAPKIVDELVMAIKEAVEKQTQSSKGFV